MLDGIIITMDDLSRAVRRSNKTVSGISTAVNFVYPCRKSPLQRFISLLYEIFKKKVSHMFLKARCG